MSMTRKHYTALAEVLGKAVARAWRSDTAGEFPLDWDTRAQHVHQLAHEIAKMLQSDSFAFDMPRFKRAINLQVQLTSDNWWDNPDLTAGRKELFDAANESDTFDASAP